MMSNNPAPPPVCSTCVISLLDLVDEEILVLDPRGCIITANKRFCQERGVVRENLAGRPASEIFHGEPGGLQAEDSPFRQALATGQTVETTYSMADTQGHTRSIRLSVSPITDQDGDVAMVAEIRRDVTHTRHMERQLKQSERLAAIGELSSYVAHEIRNPLFMISGFANSLLRSPGLDANAREKVNIIIEQSKRLDSILASFSDFVRPTSSTAEETDIHEVIRDVIPIVQNARDQDDSGKSAVRVSMDLAQDLPLVLAQHDRLKQILINIFNNAFEAMPHGGELTISTFLKHEMVNVTLADTGSGIPRDLLPNVFNPFFSTKDKGAGLGLPQSRKMLDEMGGEIELDSAPDQGTIVTLRLPPVLAAEA